MEYRLDKKAIGVQKDSFTDTSLIPLPVHPRDFEENAFLYNGIVVKSYESREDESYIYIKAELSYQWLEELFDFLGIDGKIENSESRRSLTMTFLEPGEKPNEETMEVIRAVFAQDSLEFDLNFPSAIKSSTHGEVKGKQVQYKSSLESIYQNGEKGFVWTISW